ncbi:MAG: hypothetical protein HOI25_09455, partial [Proteobacteria bacterium]|nr:hypothetical protein [Pseudomonadota bacterium]
TELGHVLEELFAELHWIKTAGEMARLIGHEFGRNLLAACDHISHSFGNFFRINWGG